MPAVSSGGRSSRGLRHNGCGRKAGQETHHQTSDNLSGKKITCGQKIKVERISGVVGRLCYMIMVASSCFLYFLFLHF